jgi:hypothetical protein
MLRVQDVGLSGVSDPEILEWATEHERIVVTSDLQTFIGFAYQRLEGGKKMPGLIVVRQRTPLDRAAEDVILMAECGLEAEWESQVVYLPLRT